MGRTSLESARRGGPRLFGAGGGRGVGGCFKVKKPGMGVMTGPKWVENPTRGRRVFGMAEAKRDCLARVTRSDLRKHLEQLEVG